MFGKTINSCRETKKLDGETIKCCGETIKFSGETIKSERGNNQVFACVNQKNPPGQVTCPPDRLA